MVPVLLFSPVLRWHLDQLSSLDAFIDIFGLAIVRLRSATITKFRNSAYRGVRRQLARGRRDRQNGRGQSRAADAGPGKTGGSTPCKADYPCTSAGDAGRGQGAGSRANRRRCRTAAAGCTAECPRAHRRVTGTPSSTAAIRRRRSPTGRQIATLLREMRPPHGCFEIIFRGRNGRRVLTSRSIPCVCRVHAPLHSRLQFA
jgi:hypothetical protein